MLALEKPGRIALLDDAMARRVATAKKIPFMCQQKLHDLSAGRHPQIISTPHIFKFERITAIRKSKSRWNLWQAYPTSNM